MFDVVDSILLAFGLKIIQRSRIIKIINLLCLNFVIIDCCYHLIYDWLIPNNVIFSLKAGFVLHIVSFFVVHHRFRTNRIRLRRLYESINRRNVVPLKVMLILIGFYLMASILNIGVYFIGIFVNGIYLSPEMAYLMGESTSLGFKIIYIVRHLYFSFVRDNWNQIVILPFVYFTVAIEIDQQRYLKDHPLTSFGNKPKIHDLLSHKKSSDKMRAIVEHIFTFSHLVIAFVIFMATTADIVYIVRAKLPLSYIAIVATRTTVRIVNLFVTVLIVNHYRTSTIILIHDMIGNAIKEYRLIGQFDVCLVDGFQRQMTSSVDYTGGGLYKLDRSFVLSYLGGLISFTIIFLQLSGIN